MAVFEEYAILTDSHWPYESKAYDLALQVLADRPLLHEITLGGDVLEVESLSTHLQNPRGRKLFLDEIEYANFRLEELRKLFPDLPITFFEGNHCDRFRRFLSEIAPQLWGLEGLSIPELLHLKERNIRWIPYGPRQLSRIGKSNLYYRHEPIGGGKGHAKGTAESSAVDICYGHTHMHQSFAVKRIGPEESAVRATSLPFLGDDRHSIFDYRGARDAWERGFALASCETRSGEYELTVTTDQGKPGSPRYVIGGKVYA